MKSQASSFNVDRVRRLIFCAGRAVAGAAGCAGVMDGPHRRGVRSMLSRMVCGAGRWLRAIALKIRCAGEHVLVAYEYIFISAFRRGGCLGVSRVKNYKK